MRRARPAATVLAAAVVLAACSGSDAAPPASPAPSSPVTTPADPGTPSSPEVTSSSDAATSTPDTTVADAGEDGAEAEVAIADFAFAPDPVEVPAGATITWTNQDSTAHTASVTGDGPDTGSISGGRAASLAFDTPGTYDYVCQFHPGTMTGTIVVR